jgi:uncharacterized protein
MFTAEVTENRARLHIFWLVPVLLLFMLKPAMLPPAYAEADGPDFYAVAGVSVNDVLNIRSGPDAGARKIGSIPYDGRGLRNLGCEGDPSFAEWQRMNAAERKAAARQRWCRIEYQGIRGWVAGWYLTEDSAPAPADASKPVLAVGIGPSFDCAQVGPESTAAIVCRDEQLAALDRELARLYELAAAGVLNARHDALVVAQRSWLKGRDDCLNADDKIDCIVFSYLDRIAQLRKGYAATRAQDDAGISRGPVPFACGDGVPVSATFVATDLPLAHLARLQNDFALELQASGSGARYAGDYIQFWVKGEQATFRLPAGNETNCSVDESGGW